MTANTTTEAAVSYTDLLRNNRNFRFLWFGQIVSLLGDWFNLVASAALVGLLTQSGLCGRLALRRAHAGAIPRQPHRRRRSRPL